MNISDLKTADLEQACIEFRVKELYIFGSILTGEFSESSDLDFLVVFDRAGYEGAFDQFMGLKERLQEIYNRSVDLIPLTNFRNQIFEEEVNKTKTLLYAA